MYTHTHTHTYSFFPPCPQDWRERMLVLRDGILCFVSDKQPSVLKRVCDVGKVHAYTSCICTYASA